MEIIYPVLQSIVRKNNEEINAWSSASIIRARITLVLPYNKDMD